MVDLARKILLYDKTRFAVTVMGVAFAVALVFVQVGLFEGLLSNASVTIEQSAADLWITSLSHPYFAYGLLGWMAVYVPVNVFAVARLHKLSFAYAEASSALRGQMVDTTACEFSSPTNPLVNDRSIFSVSTGNFDKRLSEE